MVYRTIGLRQFLTRAALGSLVLAGLPGAAGAAPPTAATAHPVVTPHPALTPVPPLALVHVRKEVSSLTAAQIDAYRKGVALMQSRGFSDPTSWIYQANMHGFPTNNTICPVIGTPQEAWSTCQHGSFFFLAWHRMYIYYFERILQASIREALHNPTYQFSLPFWNYEDATHRTLPKPFRDPANSTNPLYVQKRTTNCNNGQPCISAADASDTVALGLIPFCSGPGGTAGAGCMASIDSDESFGGGFVPAPTHSGSGPGELELQPHGVVHNAVGGNTGWMSFFTCAARDPIFWLHHANIDRLWQVWLNQQAGRKNPIANGEWTKQTFTFFDENKHKVTMTACQILNSATQLHYKYDGVPVNNIQLCPTTPVVAAAPEAAVAAPRVVASSPAGETRLRDAPVSVDVALPAQTEAAPSTAKKTRLAVEGVKVLSPGGIYQVYLNLPEGKKPDPAGPYFLGNISIFGDPEHTGEITRSFDISSKAKALRQKGGKVHLTFVREKLDTTPSPEAAQDFLSFKRVSIVEH